MKKERIEELIVAINAEMEDAERYAKAAVMCRSDDRDYSKLLCDLAAEELQHAARLYAFAVDHLKEIREECGTISIKVQKQWDTAHEVYIKWRREILDTM